MRIMKWSIIESFDPIIELVQAFAYPIAFVMATSGFFVIMTGNKHRGMDMIKWATVGFLGSQFVPRLMAILIQVGEQLKAGAV